MNMWLIADTHFFHRRMIELCGRPEDFTHLIISNWQAVAKPDGITIHLGDAHFGRNADLKPILDSIPGRKWLIQGNHDGNGKRWYLRNGFDWVGDAMLYNGVWLTHEPSKILPEGAFINIHGHLHNTKPADHKEFPHCKLLSLEYTDYKPVDFDKFVGRERTLSLKSDRLIL